MPGSYKTGGLRQKYVVTKADGSPVDPQAEYFVLRLDADPHARKAALAYAESIGYENPRLADDIRIWVKSFEMPQGLPFDGENRDRRSGGGAGAGGGGGA